MTKPSTDNDSPETKTVESLSPAVKSPKKKAKRVVLLFVVPLLIIAGSGFIYLTGGRYVETDNAYVKADKTLINVEVPGRVTKVLVKENQQVKSGQLLLTIDAKPYKIAVQQARSHLDDVRTGLLTTKAEYKSKLANLAVSENQYNFAKREEKRQYDLWQKKYSSQAEYEAAENKSLLFQLQTNMFKTQLKQIAESLGGDIERPVELHPKYKLAQAQLAQAKYNLQHVELRAPADGVVSKVMKKGQYISPNNTTMLLVANTHLWIEANFTEKEMTNVKVGQKVAIDVDYAPDNQWTGHVKSISPATGAEYSVIPAQNATGNWVKVTQRLPIRIQITPQKDAPQLRAGMSATVTVDTQNERHLDL
ncbi:HlyD family secretion protein [Vibrio algicola]|uniref:HlyD family efflux transporter periplasmic adaptor subunit n=1 Tax=Vibrio algicola TaxID=2662262 RepID=A0A5Q0TGW5_9VIBR|nr:HlyD family secretion protein [Vibrio algicola]